MGFLTPIWFAQKTLAVPGLNRIRELFCIRKDIQIAQSA